MTQSDIANRQRSPNLGKLSIAILEGLVEKIIGESAIDEIRKPSAQKEIADSLAEALARVETNFIKLYTDKNVCNLLMQLPIHDLSSAKATIWAFYERPNDTQFQEFLIEQMSIVGQLSDLQINNAVVAYMKLLKRELINIDAKLRDKIQALAVLDIADVISSKIDHITETNLPQVITIIESETDLIPTPPALYSEPPYIGSHKFVGRRAQLEILDDWAQEADTHPVLLFDAIGGSGKSMLTWEWTTKYATRARGDWAGRFWYSFYERGAIMADFCRHALAYITRKPLDKFQNKKTVELGQLLMHQLQARPWLLVLDGLERVLVLYNRFDAAQVPDEVVNSPSDPIVNRDPCASIRPEDDDLLRALTAAAPSKLLITSRLIPRVLLNPANQPIPGVRRESLPGLLPTDAEALLRSCEITGNSLAIQDYLKRHCDCHPLVTGVLAGLINDYLPNKGNFDSWESDPTGGRQLNLANLDLIQRRNHILKAAIDALPDKSHQLLSTLALLSGATDHSTLSAFNPHMPLEPQKVDEPTNPNSLPTFEEMSEDDKKREQESYEVNMQRRKEYEQIINAWRQSPEFLTAPQELTNTVRDLERRGLIQYDKQSRRFDLHPVVRGIAVGVLGKEETDHYGKRVVDYFSQRAHNPYDQAESLEDLRNSIHIVRTLIKMERYQEASSYVVDFSDALLINLEAYAELLALLRPFFPKSWVTLPTDLGEWQQVELAMIAGKALYLTNELAEALTLFGALLLSELEKTNWQVVITILKYVSVVLGAQNRLAKEEQFLLFAIDLATLLNDKENLPQVRLSRFLQLATLGRWVEAEAMWQLIDPAVHDSNRQIYNPGTAEYAYTLFKFLKGDLMEEHLTHAEQLAKMQKRRISIRGLNGLHGEWMLEQGQWALAAEYLHEAVRLARTVDIDDIGSEIELAIAKFQLGQLHNASEEAERLSQSKDPFHRGLAELWLSIGNHERAEKHALMAYKEAWADGEPYVDRYELNKDTTLIEKLGMEIPKLPPYDPNKDEKLPWEDEVISAIEKLRLEKAAKESPRTGE